MHPFGDLSAYLDGALSSEASASVHAHLDTCALCRTRLSELRGTARLIAGLPMPVPSRSLVPRISVPFWLAPLRTFSTFASGAAIFLFLASAVLSSFPRAVGTSAPGAGGAPAAAPAPNTLSAPQPTGALAGDSASAAPSEFMVSAPTAVPSPGGGPTGSIQVDDAAKEATRQEAVGSASNTVADQSTRSGRAIDPFAALTSPWLWLAVGMAFAGLSFILGRRLRST